jgi:beta-lysine 5,6-aminomutase beta subunit
MMREGVDYSRVRPYADHLDDGIVQVNFTLPVPHGAPAQKAALQIARSMGLSRAEVIHEQPLTRGYTYFVVYGQCTEAVDFAMLAEESSHVGYLTAEEVDDYVDRHIGRPVVAVGASTGTDTHSVGIDAMLNLKGYHGHHGLEGYRGFTTYNLGSQVPNAELVAKAIEVDADVILVSQTVTQQALHMHNLTELVEIVEAEGLRERVLLVCGGPRMSDELAKELGFDAGFGRGTYPFHLASYLVTELTARNGARPAEVGTGCA